MMKLKKMILIIIIFIISLGGGLADAKEKESKNTLAHIEKTKGVEQLILSDKVKKYISKQFPGYHVPTIKDKKLIDEWTYFIPKEKLPPVYALADFDGNQQEDLALLLMSKEYSVGFVVILNQVGKELKYYVPDPSSTVRIHCLNISVVDGAEIMTFYRKEGYGIKDPDTLRPEEVVLKNQGLNIGGCSESLSSSVYWANGRYHQIWESD